MYWNNTYGSRRAEFNSPQLESKIYNGIPANGILRNYVVSLQINDIHICSAGWFDAHFMITTGRCVHYIKTRMVEHSENGTVVLGSSRLNQGKRFNILFLLHHPKFRPTKPEDSTDYDVGLIMIEKTIKESHMKILPLYEKTYDHHPSDHCYVCGWGSNHDDEKVISVGNKNNYSDSLHCMKLMLEGDSYCSERIEGDFKNLQFCGHAKTLYQRIVSADVGSPLTTCICEQFYIVGVTTDQIRENFELIRFVQISSVYKDIQRLMIELTLLAGKLNVKVRGAPSIVESIDF